MAGAGGVGRRAPKSRKVWGGKGKGRHKSPNFVQIERYVWVLPQAERMRSEPLTLSARCCGPSWAEPMCSSAETWSSSESFLGWAHLIGNAASWWVISSFNTVRSEASMTQAQVWIRRLFAVVCARAHTFSYTHMDRIYVCDTMCNSCISSNCKKHAWTPETSHREASE